MGAISLRNVEKTYGSGPKAVKVIHGVDAEISDGEFVVIVGPSGCGKSTFMKLATGLKMPTLGRIRKRFGHRVAPICWARPSCNCY